MLKSWRSVLQILNGDRLVTSLDLFKMFHDGIKYEHSRDTRVGEVDLWKQIKKKNRILMRHLWKEADVIIWVLITNEKPNNKTVAPVSLIVTFFPSRDMYSPIAFASKTSSSRKRRILIRSGVISVALASLSEWIKDIRISIKMIKNSIKEQTCS